ncbi:hypothetical protein BH23PLA1_BH23PLA1_26200 [soil metagenome]
MIALTRLQARRLRAVFRRRPLGINHKGLVPPLIWHNDPAGGLRVRHHRPPLAVECSFPASAGSASLGTLLLPLEALADFEGKDEAAVTLEPGNANRVLARWTDRGIPQVREYVVPALDSLPEFPKTPDTFQTCPAVLLDALAEATATTDAASTRYALDCLQLRGETGEIIATDGRQILIRGGFIFPWPGDVLMRGAPVFAVRDLPRDRPVRIGCTDGHVVVQTGGWTFWPAIATEARFPRIENAIPDPATLTTRLRLDPTDIAFLATALDRLPGADEHNAPVTLDGNGEIIVRARAADREHATELVLSRSRCSGPPARLATNRAYLARALQLGFTEIGLSGPSAAVCCRHDSNCYIWQPLHHDAAIGPSANAVRIASTTAASASVSAVEPMALPRRTRRLMNSSFAQPNGHSCRDPAQGHHPSTNGHAAPPDLASEASSTGTATLIQEAAALHEALSDARARAQRLIAALRRQRKRDRAVKSALDSLRQLKLQEVAE